MILLADATPDPKLFTAFWVIMSFLAGIAANVATVIALTRKQKREITYGFTPASKEEFVKHVEWNNREHENLFKKIGGAERGSNERLELKVQAMQSSAEIGRASMSQKVEDVKERVAGLERATEAQNQWLERMDSKLDLIQRRNS